MRPAPRSALRGVVGTRPAGLDVQAMRAVRSRARAHRAEVLDARDPKFRERAARIDFGVRALQRLIEREEMKLKAQRRHRRRARRRRRRRG